jgi:rhamnosyltransferase
VNTSIVVRTKNEGKFLGKTLDLIRQQAYTPRPEIIVVDSGSTDDTLAIASRQDGLRIVKIPAEEFTYARSLNTGFRASGGDVIVALSAHAFPRGEHWLERLVSHFSDPKVAGVYGRQLPHDDAWPSVKRDYLEFYGQQLRIQTDPDNPNDHCFSNAASAIRRELWEKHPFDEKLPYCEDWEWARSMLMLGHRIVYEPDAAVYHSHNESLRVVYRRCQQEMLARKLLYKQQFDRNFQWYRIWARSVAADMSFIQKNGQHKKWFFWVLFYRLFWAMGRSSHFLSR